MEGFEKTRDHGIDLKIMDQVHSIVMFFSWFHLKFELKLTLSFNQLILFQYHTLFDSDMG